MWSGGWQPSRPRRPPGGRTYIIKDVRLFLNSVDRGLRLIRDAGVDAPDGAGGDGGRKSS